MRCLPVPLYGWLTIGRLMTKQNFGGLPVVGDNGILVRAGDRVRPAAGNDRGRDLRKVLASEIMTTQPLTVREEMLLEEVANLFQDRYATRLPVVRGRHSLDWRARRDLLHGT